MKDIKYIEIIKNCPLCGANIKIKTSDTGVEVLYCENEQCPGKLANRIDHYCSRTHGLDIKGISRKTIDKLIHWGFLNGLADIYGLEQHKTEWISKEGFGTASVGKILSSIDATRSGSKMENFLSAIGIPLVGRTIAKEIVKYYPTWEEFRAAVGRDWSEFDGFGYEISKAINNFDYTEADQIAELITFKQEEKEEIAAAAAIKDKIFCITGKIHTAKNREELKHKIESLGGKVTNSVTSKTNYLINNDVESTTSKNLTAKKLGVPIISEEELVSMMDS